MADAAETTTKAGVQHASFTIERDYDATPAQTFAAWARPEAKARWFVGPDDWHKSGHTLDFRVGGEEHLSGSPPGGEPHHYRAIYHHIAQDRCIVYSYLMHLGDTPMSVSLATVEFGALANGGTRLRFTEQDAFLDDRWGVASREEGTRGLLDQLAAALCTLGTSRVLAATPEQVFAAFRDPARLARWWGPKDFRNSFKDFDFRTGGAWRFTMHGPDGTDYPNESVFTLIDAPRRIVIDHYSGHRFTLTITLTATADGGTRLDWAQRFTDAAHAERVRVFVDPANEQNLDRLAAELAG